MIVKFRAGQRVVSDGSDVEPRLGRYLAQAVMDAHGRYYDAVDRGNCYMGAMQSAAALGTALTATAVTLTLYNPPGSGVQLEVLEATLALVTATLAGFVVLAVNADPGASPITTGTAAAIRNCKLNTSAGAKAKLYTACTLPAAPVVHRVLAGVISTTPGGIHSIVDDVGGRIVLPPNTAMTIQGVTTNATGVAAFMWQENVP